MKRSLLLMMSILMVLSVAYAEQEYREYTIKKGDTLWDISGSELKDHFLWPKIWKENPQIKNPDLIFPGQTLRIPLKLIQRQVEVPEERPPEIEIPQKKEKPVKIKPEQPFIVNAALIASSGYIDREIPQIGRVTATPTGRTLIGSNEYAYIEVYNRPVKEGDRFYTLKSLGEVKHPKTGKFLGYLIQITGVVEVVGTEAGYMKAKVLKSFYEIETGSPLDIYQPIEPFPLVKVKAREGLHGTVVAARELRLINGLYDILHIDLGYADGVRPGNVFTVISGRKPHRPIGEIQVVSARAHTSVAMVIKSEQEISVGDYF